MIEQAGRQDSLPRTPWTVEEWKEGTVGVVDWIVEQNHRPLTRLALTSDDGFTQKGQTLLFQSATE